jgi:hypothetical protein
MHAIDAIRSHPQIVSTARGSVDCRLSFSAPIPSWAERRLLVVGQRADEHDRGALATFIVPNSEVDEEIAFLRSNLWLVFEESVAGDER